VERLGDEVDAEIVFFPSVSRYLFKWPFYDLNKRD